MISEVRKRGVARIVAPCVHHWLLDPSDAVCRCEGEPHYHGACKFCGASGQWPVDLNLSPQELQREYKALMASVV